MKKGYIIVIEGTDGSGKQTQAEMLKQKLKQIAKVPVYECSFPNYDSASSAPVKMYLGGELSESANEIDAYQASTIFATDRLCTYFTDIAPHYNAGEIIILDRYTPSNALHQAGKIADLKAKDKFLNWLFKFEYKTLKLPKPNNIIFLNVPIHVTKKLREERNKTQSLKAGTKQDIHEKDEKHLEKAYESGKYVSEKYHWTTIKCTKSDNLLSREEIHTKILSALLEDKNFAKLTK